LLSHGNCPDRANDGPWGASPGPCYRAALARNKSLAESISGGRWAVTGSFLTRAWSLSGVGRGPEVDRLCRPAGAADPWAWGRAQTCESYSLKREAVLCPESGHPSAFFLPEW